MRIIAGKYRGRTLKSPPSRQTRPTSDRLRETLFNILAPQISGSRFLDLCAGSGAVGCEALSRGAAHATFVDQSRKMTELIEANLRMLKLDGDHFKIVLSEAAEYLRKCAKQAIQPSDIIFFDPPYASDYETVVCYLGENSERLLSETGLVIVEHDKRKAVPDRVAELERYRVLRQGDSCLSFYQAT
jgi:16S rRNA (guanine966-N2)-methyltransferase